MTTTDWRELCAELANDLQEARDAVADWAAYASEYFQQKHDLQGELDRINCRLARARAALAQPEPEVVGPTDEELLELAQHHSVSYTMSDGTVVYPLQAGCDMRDDVLSFARAAITADRARWGRPAPAPAEEVGPSDDSAEEWQWYTYCPEEGIELYPNRQQAQSAAQSIMGSYEVAAHSDGWHEDMELVSWGMLVPVEQAQVVERRPADPGGEFDEWVRYELRAVARWGRPAPASAGEVAEVAAWPRAYCDEEFAPLSIDPDVSWLTRAADLLERQAALAPAEGEVAEVIADLRECADSCILSHKRYWAEPMRRAADLLECQAAPVPVVVSEQQPGAEDCIAEEMCWRYWPPTLDRWATWSLSCGTGTETHWLPAHALPIPEQGDH